MQNAAPKMFDAIQFQDTHNYRLIYCRFTATAYCGMNASTHPNMDSKHMLLTQKSTVVDVVSFLNVTKDEEELKSSVNSINTQGKLVFGSAFNLRLDETSMSRKLRDRVLLRIP